MSGWRPEERRADRRAPRDLWDSRALYRIGVIDAAAGRAVPAIRSYESARRDYLHEWFRLAGERLCRNRFHGVILPTETILAHHPPYGRLVRADYG